MADVRALLKAKTKEREARIQDPYASYNAAGQLRCALCGTTIKFNNATAWKTHVDSKSHKATVEKEKARLKGKRKADEEEMDVDSDSGSKKRKVQPVASGGGDAPQETNGFPSDFFSDPNRKLPDPMGEDEGGANIDGPSIPNNGAAASVDVEDEFAAFEKAIAAASAKKAPTNFQDVFSRATIAAEPELVDVNALEADGFPPEVAEGSAQAPTAAPVDEAVEPEETEAQKAKRLEREEKELIMDRMLDEERAQEEADDRVRSLKARLDAIKKKRETKKKPSASPAL